MDSEALQFQNQLHEANQERMRAMETKLDLILRSVLRTDAVCESWPKLLDRVDTLEKQREYRKGFVAAAALVGGYLGKWMGTWLEWMIHHLIGK